ncbi:hypothetical protein AGABI2DRAFT_123000 [Agaricus bisporus var. bisporus H97]|uniref:hypothetical protein n=1 Tax=Agaricus bisporus var. bisporus (strain H97 / ATCC MYA-4626 / FGSC 10389) TaxID=936046 RepID=UPI00029F6FA2|nr:hypothetical protein AGABI2DRAFT_123000 [Agaricus bisporus var. bisporus H97]EKV42277.1 hypothetical protein AGABI2DRAFT_123000 [Agaricus bisporus var. bisporus H97]
MSSSLTTSLFNFAYEHRFIIGTLSLLNLTIIYKIILYPLYISPLRHIPGPPLFPLLKSKLNPFAYLLAPIKGQFPAIITGEAGIPQREWLKHYGGEKGIIRVVGPVGIERLLFLSPEACERILVKEWVDYPRPKFMRDILGLVAGYGLLTVTRNEHKQMRRMMNPAFSLPNLVSQMDEYHRSIDSLLKIFDTQISTSKTPESGLIIPTYEWMSKVTLDIICSTAFSYHPNSLHDPHNELATAYEKLIDKQDGPNLAWFIGMVSVVPGFCTFVNSRFSWRIRKWIRPLPELGLIAVVIESMHQIRTISKRMLDQKMRDESHSDVMERERKKDIMSLLVRARKESLESQPRGSWSLSDEAMMDQVLTFLGAGHETTASGLAWTLYLLAANKQAQTHLREELTPIFNDNPKPEYKSLKELQYLDNVIMEGLRLFPPVPMTFRQAAKTDYIDGVLVPKGTLLYIPIRVINTWKSTWGPDAEEFHPERWSNLSIKNYNSQYSFMSFIFGPHACIGKTMAIIEMKTVIASLIVNFEFDLAFEGQIPKPTAAVTMKPKDNMPLRVRRVNRG